MRINSMMDGHMLMACFRLVHLSWIIGMMIHCPVYADPVNGETSCNLTESAPVVHGNILFSAYSDKDTPDGEDKRSRGHVVAVRMYDPVDPGHTEKAELWDAGCILNEKDPDNRKIIFPQMMVTQMSDVTIATGDGHTRVFSGTLQGPIIATTVRITDHHEMFCDEPPNVLRGDSGGIGNLNRFSGIFHVMFNEPPADGASITGSYACYRADSALVFLNKSTVNLSNLALNDTRTVSGSYLYDFNRDGMVAESDGDWLVQWVRGFGDGLSMRKDWVLGAVDLSVPAVAVPPGRTHWYYGFQVTERDRNGYDDFVKENQDRPTVLYVGSKDGMLHAFDAGKFCWNDNPETPVVENRGYFEWQALVRDFALNQFWSRLLTRYSAVPPDFRWQGMKNGNKAPNYGTGEELWAFVPPNLIPMLKNNLLNAEGQASMDVSATIADVQINGAWRTVLVSAEGGGGGTIFCLDITKPETPLFLWEFAEPGFRIRTDSQTAIPVGRIALGGKGRWAGFLGSGKPSEPGLDPCIYLIDIDDGSLIRGIGLHAGIDTDGDYLDDGAGGIPVGQPVVLDTDGNGYVDRMYVGTDRGFVFKITISDDPAVPGDTICQCVINMDFYYEDCDGYTRLVPQDQQYQSLHHSPAVVVDHHSDRDGQTEYTVKIFFGTGDNPCGDDRTGLSNGTFNFFSYSDRSIKGECRSDRIFLDWHKVLPQGHRVFSAPVAAAGTVYFGTSTGSSTDECGQESRGRIYALDIHTGSVIHEQAIGNITTAIQVEDEHLYFKSSLFQGKTPLVMGGGPYNNDAIKGTDARNGIRAWKEIW